MVNEKGQIRFGFGEQLTEMGGAYRAIYMERQNRRFKDIYDFFERMPSSGKSIKSSGKFGDCRCFERIRFFITERNILMWIMVEEPILKSFLCYGQSFQDNKNSWKNSLFLLILVDEVQIERPKTFTLCRMAKYA